MDDEPANDPLSAAWEALAVADWERARSCFESAIGKLAESAEVFDGLGQAVHFQGDYERAIELMERAFAAYRRRGDRLGAVRPARWLAFLHGAVHGNIAVANGWMARAEGLFEGVGECVERGWLTLDRAHRNARPPRSEPAARRPRASKEPGGRSRHELAEHEPNLRGVGCTPLDERLRLPRQKPGLTALTARSLRSAGAQFVCFRPGLNIARMPR